MANTDLTADDLKSVLFYEPISGHFRWLDPKRNGRSHGRAGCALSTGYRGIRVGQYRYQEHRLAWLFMTGDWPAADIDHINGVRTDNRFENLRSVDRRTNSENQRKGRRGLLGACYLKKSGRWTAFIGVNYKNINLGSFATEEEAHAAYLTEKRRVHAGCMI